MMPQHDSQSGSRSLNLALPSENEQRHSC